MAKSRSTGSASQWTATYRYSDVYECTNGTTSLSHSIRGLEAARKALETGGDDFAMKQLQVVNAKLEAISRAATEPATNVAQAPVEE